MKYKEFIAMAATKIAAQQMECLSPEMMVKVMKDGTVSGPSDKVENIISGAVIAAKALAEELEDDFVYEKSPGDNHKMKEYEEFFDDYDE